MTDEDRKDLHFSAIGTSWRITLPDIAPEVRGRVFLLIQAYIETFEETFSRFRPNSFISRLARESGTFNLPPHGFELLEAYRFFFEKTSGAFTPLIGITLNDAGYDPSYRLTSRDEVRQAPPWDDRLTYTSTTMTTTMPLTLDFGGLGKGYLIDRVGELLERENIHSYCIDAGGDIRYRSQTGEPLRVGLENPLDTTEVLGISDIYSGSICGSAGSRRAWKGYHHIINGKNATSPRDILASWVTAPTTLMADGLATCLFFSEAEAFQGEQFSYAIVSSDGTGSMSERFPGVFF